MDISDQENINTISSIIEKLDSINANMKKRQSYKIDFKILIIDYLNSIKNDPTKLKIKHIIQNRYNIPKSTLNDWFKNIDKYKLSIKTNKKRMPGGGRKSILKDIEKEILYYILDVRRSGYSITTKAIIAYIYSLSDEYSKYSYDRLRFMVRGLLEKYNLSIRKASHIGQPLPNDVDDLIYTFLFQVTRQRKILHINDFQLNRIINCDETCIFYENPSTNTIDIKGNKEVIINTEGNEDKKISVLLTIAGDGTKLPPYLIFKGKEEKSTEKDLQKNEHVLNQKVFACCQRRAWCDTSIFLKWYHQVYLHYEKNVIKQKCLLILDKCPSHFNEEVNDQFKENKTYYVYIPGGLTRYLQPLDLGINMPFKSALKSEYLINKANEIKNKNMPKASPKIQRDNIINIINDVWWTEKIKKSSIINSFHKAGITLKLDGSEDENWKFPETMTNNFSIYDDFEKKIKKNK